MQPKIISTLHLPKLFACMILLSEETGFLAKLFSVSAEIVQRSAKVLVHGCKKFVPALAYLSCLALLGSCLARFAYFLADLCNFAVSARTGNSLSVEHHYTDTS